MLQPCGFECLLRSMAMLMRWTYVQACMVYCGVFLEWIPVSSIMEYFENGS